MREPGIELGIELGLDEPASSNALREDMLLPFGLNLANDDCCDIWRIVCWLDDSCEFFLRFGEACLTIELQLT